MQTIDPHQLARVIGGMASPNQQVGPQGSGGQSARPQTFSNTGGRTPGNGGSAHTLQNGGGGATPEGGGGGGTPKDTGFIGV